jgi:hypothetical protein
VFDSLTEMVAVRMQAERLARAEHERRLSEAERAATGQAGDRFGRRAIAQALRGLATWLAPGAVAGESAPA